METSLIRRPGADPRPRLSIYGVVRHASSKRSLLLPGDAPVPSPLLLPNFASPASVGFREWRLETSDFRRGARLGEGGGKGGNVSYIRVLMDKTGAQDAPTAVGRQSGYSSRKAWRTLGNALSVRPDTLKTPRDTNKKCVAVCSDSPRERAGGRVCKEPYRRVLTRSYQEFGVGHEHIRFCCVPLQVPNCPTLFFPLPLPATFASIRDCVSHPRLYQS